MMPASPTQYSFIVYATDQELAQAASWLERLGRTSVPIVMVQGSSSKRRAIYRHLQADEESSGWIQSISANLAKRFAKIRVRNSIIPHEWDILWNLLTTPVLEVSPSLKLLVDQGHILTHVFRGIWEARFSLSEEVETKEVIAALSGWISSSPLTEGQLTMLKRFGIEQGLATIYERFDALLFLATLARFNDMLDPQALVLDGLDAALEGPGRKGLLNELLGLHTTAERWARLGCPIGFVVGHTNAIGEIQRLNPKLGRRLQILI